MKSESSSNIIKKDVVIIGNGPSGLVLSYMLSGNIPHLISTNHPDEMLSARLHTLKSNSLVHQELGFLASGLEGRTSNPVSLLLDSLSHPCADIGFELDPLIEWRKDGVEIDHVVLGKGPPGGSWHQMDPCILTLSLGSWMALPGLPYTGRDGLEKRASAGNIAQYYLRYVNEMNLNKNFRNNICVTSTKQFRDVASEVDESRSIDNIFGENCAEFDRMRVCASNKWIQKIEEDECETVYSNPENEENIQNEQRRKRVCSLSNAFNFIRLRSNRKCKRRRDGLAKNDASPDRKIREISPTSICIDGKSCDLNGSISDYKDHVILCKPPHLTTTPSRAAHNKKRSISFSCDFDNLETSRERLCSRSYSDQISFINPIRNSYSLDFNNSIMRVPQALSNNCDMKYDNFRLKENCDPSTSSLIKRNKNQNDGMKWLIESYDTSTGKCVTYLCRHLVLASGASDMPNRLTVSNGESDPNWLVHDVRSLELKLDGYIESKARAPDPVLIIGAGLSAADAIIATRCRNIPVLHVFRNKTTGFGKQLPENMYPEYHKVHQMMQDGGSSYPLYTALPEFNLTEFNETERTVKLTSKLGEELKFHVSFAAVLIGARPDLNFLPQYVNLGKNKSVPVDNKTNNMDVNKLTHAVNGFDNLYAMGPLVGDNFVRFIPGGALAIVNDLYTKYNY